jgi:antibiotic biosynthesis monooxygenase (ABM) superfamily enzyme
MDDEQTDSARIESIPKLKWAVAVWLALAPTLVLFHATVGRVFRPLPFIPRIVLGSPFTVVFMVWVALPLVMKLLEGWLYPRTN